MRLSTDYRERVHNISADAYAEPNGELILQEAVVVGIGTYTWKAFT